MPNKLGKASALGRGLQRHHQTGGRHRGEDGSHRHTTETTSVSVTENSSIDDFLADAEAAQRSFAAIRGQAEIVGPDISATESNNTSIVANDARSSSDSGSLSNSLPFQSVPRRPCFLPGESGEVFRQREQDAFLQWKRGLNNLNHSQNNSMLYEKNVEFWRQFWHMIELSQVVVQVVDARDANFFRNVDLEHYVEKEMTGDKMSILMLNKADLLSKKQRQYWAQYYADQGARSVFFSAAMAANEIDEDYDQEEKTEDLLSFNTARILRPVQLMRLLLHRCSIGPSSLSVGFLGYPNVGKSSSINCLLNSKRLRVSATPGKTKHFQTHIIHVDGDSCLLTKAEEKDDSNESNDDVEEIDDILKEDMNDEDIDANIDNETKREVTGLKKHVVLVDGPGLVMANPTMTKAQMVLNGILPIDTLTEYSMPMELLVDRIGLSRLMEHYNLPRRSLMDAKRVLGHHKLKTSDIFINAFCLVRGLVRVGGLPDGARGARVVLKDFVQGRLLHVQAPPNVDQKSFDECGNESKPNKLDDEDFSNMLIDDLSLEESLPELRSVAGVHVRGHHKKVGVVGKKHGNKNKREKARRVFKNAYE